MSGSDVLRHSKIRLAVAAAVGSVVVAGVLIPGSVPARSQDTVGNEVLERGVAIELGQVTPKPYEQLLSSGTMYSLLQATGELEERVGAAAALDSAAAPSAAQQAAGVSSARTQGCRNVFTGGGVRNIRVNQDCSLRRQAEEVVVINPTNPNNLIAGQNDSRLGFNHCGYDWSFDRGRTWGDQTPPFWQFLLADNATADACSDPTIAFDSQGNAYVGGILFNLVSPANAIVVAKSNAPNGGAFYHSPQPGPFQEFSTDPLGVVVNEADPAVFHDKELIVADASPTSPKADNVYATWTRFDLDTGVGVGAHSPIVFSQSTDGGATWSPLVTISGSSAQFCGLFSGSADPNACDQDQGSHPIVGADGTIYVVFGNGNTPVFGENQILFVSCPPSADCSDASSWTAPARVNDLIGTHPLGPDPATGCAAGRQCLPPNGYRVPEFTSMSTSVTDDGTLFTVWSDSRNIGANCDFDGGTPGSAATATPPCDNDVFYASSTDGGATWSPEVNIAPAAGFGPTAQWQPWSAVTTDGKRLYVAYYDRSYGTCETSGCNDITLATITDPASNSPSISHRRITTASMPNLIPANNPLQAGFLGDYMWVAVEQVTNPHGRVHVIWADTRGLNGTVEEDIYLATIP